MKTPENESDFLTDGLRLDVIRWKAELIRLRSQGQYDIAATIEEWLGEAERVLAWPNPQHGRNS
jgi:hypothetical protein